MTFLPTVHWRSCRVAVRGCSEAEMTAALLAYIEANRFEGVKGTPVTVRVVHYEPSAGTRTRRYPRGEPSTTTLWSRARSALLGVGIITTGHDIMESSVRKTWGPTHQVTIDVTWG
jgi:hypothetical protein